jgi:hypothetical protein
MGIRSPQVSAAQLLQRMGGSGSSEEGNDIDAQASEEELTHV